ncbi:unnamed protein product, partial [Vitis vinifera]|uniref:Uncharacterized protein n=1 Tax=Vitis vinifera TaxID=29760 RepID=D7TYC0_VITVI
MVLELQLPETSEPRWPNRWELGILNKK